MRIVLLRCHRTYTTLAAFATLAMLAVALPVPARNARIDTLEGRAIAANEVLVRFRSGVSQANRISARQSLAVTEDAEACAPIGDGRLLRLRSRRFDTAELIRRLSRRPDVQYAEPNYQVRIARVPNDPYFWSLWGLENTGQLVNQRRGLPGADIHAPQAWDFTTGSAEHVVGVVDTGIDYRHPDLAANVWSAPWSFPVTIGGVTMTCPQGAHGYNALNNTFDPLDDNNHGTHCAGTIGAVGNDGYGIPGVNWTASLMGLKFMDAGGHGTAADAINAIEFAIQARLVLHRSGDVRVLSNSWTVSGPSEALREQMVKADLNEMLFVAASGNSSLNLDETPAYPQSYATPNLLNVAATGMVDTLAGFSNTGANTVDLAAPGFNVISTTRNGGYAVFDGTSMAAPHVAGTAALMLARDGGLSVAQLKAGLLGGVDPQPSLQGVTRTGGRLNAYAAVRDLGPRLDYRIDLFSSPFATVAAGGSARFDVLVSTSQSYGGDVTLSFAGLPPGATAQPQVIGGGGLVSISVDTTAETPPGHYLLTLRGTGGTLSHSLTVELEVLPAPEFTLSVTPDTRSVKRGDRVRFKVRVTPTVPHSGKVALTVSGLPPGCRARFAPLRLGGARASTLTLATARSTPVGDYTLLVRGTRGEATGSAPITLIIHDRR